MNRSKPCVALAGTVPWEGRILSRHGERFLDWIVPAKGLLGEVEHLAAGHGRI